MGSEQPKAAGTAPAGASSPVSAPGGSTRAALSPSKRPRSAQEEREDLTDAYEITAFGEGGKYLRNKRKKLKLQTAGMVDADDQERPQLFRGMSIYVGPDGALAHSKPRSRSLAASPARPRSCEAEKALRRYGRLTEPLQINGLTLPLTLPELSTQISLHGGIYVPYLDKKQLATHILAPHLPPSKAVEFRKYKVARPEWVVDSVKQGRLLNWSDYSVFAAQDKGPDPEEGFAEGLFSYDDAAERLGTQFGQRSLFGLGMQRVAAAGPSGRPAPKSVGNAKEGRPCVGKEKEETLEERGKKLGNVVIQKQGLLTVHKRQPKPTPKLAPKPPTPSAFPLARRSTKSAPSLSPPLPRFPKKSASGSIAPPSPPESPARRRRPQLTVADEDEGKAVPSSSPPPITQPPPNQRALKKEVSMLILSDSDEEEEEAQEAEPKVTHESKPGVKKIDVKSKGKVKTSLSAQPQPKAPKPKQRKLGLSSSKSTLQIQPPKPRIKSEFTPSPSPSEDANPQSSAPTDDEILSLGFDLEVFRCLKLKEQRRQIASKQAKLSLVQKLTVTAPRRAPRPLDGPKLKEVEPVRPPRLLGKSEVEDVCHVIEEWVQGGKANSPRDDDLARVERFLVKVVEGSKGKGRDVPKAVEVLRWWEMVLVEQFGKEAEGQSKVGRSWLDALGRTKEKIDEAVRRTCGGSLVDF